MAPSTLSLALLVAVAHTTAQSVPCGWRHPRAGTVRDAFYLDGGQYYENTWDATGNVWEKAGSPTSEPVPAGSLQRFNYSMPFGGSKSDLVNITGKMNLVAKTAGGNYDAPSYADGAMFVSGYELYTYGYVSSLSLLSMLTRQVDSLSPPKSPARRYLSTICGLGMDRRHSYLARIQITSFHPTSRITLPMVPAPAYHRRI